MISEIYEFFMMCFDSVVGAGELLVEFFTTEFTFSSISSWIDSFGYFVANFLAEGFTVLSITLGLGGVAYCFIAISRFIIAVFTFD